MSGALDGLSLLLSQVESEVESKINAKTEEVVADVKKQLDQLKQYQPTVVVGDGKELGKIEGLQHNQISDLVKLIGANLNVLLVGMAGTGKTHSAKQVADAVGYNFYAMSVGSQTSKSDIIGYMDANGNYVTSAFRKAYEEGGVFVLDEIDAGNSNVLIILNSALSNGIMSFPDKMVTRHEDFRFVATANTYGNGADRTYVGRNQLDGATLDRFTVLDWKVDENLEGQIVSGYSWGKAWHETIKEVRRRVEKSGVRALITPRATQKGATVLELGLTDRQVVELTVLPQVPQDKRDEYMTMTLGLLQDNKVKYPKKQRKLETPEGTPAVEATTPATEAIEGEVVTKEPETVIMHLGTDEWKLVTDARGRTRFFRNGKLSTRAEHEKAVTTFQTKTAETHESKFDFEVPF